MIRWFRFFVDLSFLKVAPQDAPQSTFVFYLSIFFYFLIGTLITAQTQDFLPAIVTAGIQSILIIFLTNLILWIKKTPERFAQTVTALTGTGTFIGIIALPILVMITTSGSEEGSIASLLWLVLIIWETAVIGHIFRHSMDIPLIAGLGVALIYLYLSIAITVRLLKVMSISAGL